MLLKKVIWPNFFIVGAPRSGTTSLYEYLKKIPSIYMSKEKEPNYFSKYNRAIIGVDCKKTKKYLELFEDVKNETIIGEATATYLADSLAPTLIHRISPNAKILISLRNPVERLISHFMIFSSMYDLGSFHNFVTNPPENFIHSKTRFDYGFYFEQVKRYINTFGQNNVKVIIFEEFIENEELTIREILKFLNVQDDISKIDYKTYNASFSPKGNWVRLVMRSRLIKKITTKIFRNQENVENIKGKFLKMPKEIEVLDEDRKFLKDLYLEDMKKLEGLLAIKLPWFKNDKK